MAKKFWDVLWQRIAKDKLVILYVSKKRKNVTNYMFIGKSMIIRLIAG